MGRLLGAVVAVMVVVLLYAALTAVVPLAGFEGLLLLALLISVTVVVLRLRIRRLANRQSTPIDTGRGRAA